jgi:hypothetical protein
MIIICSTGRTPVTYLNKPLRNTGLKSLSAAFAFDSSSPSVSSYPCPAPFTRPCPDERPDASSSGTSAVRINGRSRCDALPPVVDGRRWRPIVPPTVDNNAPPVLLLRSCRFAWPCGSRIVAARRCRGCVWLCEIPPVGDTCISTLSSFPTAGTASAPGEGEVGAEVDGRSVFSFDGDDACLLSSLTLSFSFSLSECSTSVDGRGDPKLPKILVLLLLRSPDARMLPPPTRRLPNLRTSVAPVGVGGVAGIRMTSGGDESGVSDIAAPACSSSIRSANVVSSGPAVRGRSCPLTLGLTLTLSCPYSLTPVVPPVPVPNMLVKPRGTPWR